MVRKIVKFLAYILLAGGLAVLAYPHIRQRIYTQNANDIIDNYNNRVESLQKQAQPQDPEPESDEERTETPAPYLPELYAAMRAYNEDLHLSGQEGFKDAWSYEPASFDLSEWGVEEEMLGYLDIPRIDVKLPIYLGASAANMRKGAVHLTQTSLPIGGENTNCVIAAHRGYSRAAMFRDIEKIQLGDRITITNLWATLTYEVVEIKVIRPNDVKEVLIQPGRDLVSLITCHPYRHNHQRYVVYCERITAESLRETA